jgi:hypothetical protein
MTKEHEQEQPRQPTEEELRAALEEEMRLITVDDVLLQSAVSLVNLGGRKAGLAPGTEGERDLAQVQAAIDGVNALLPVLEARGREEVNPIRDALSQLQLAFARLAGEAGGPPAPPEGQPPKPADPAKPAKPGDSGPAQGSGRLWVPGR